jgi:hypothetical protein
MRTIRPLLALGLLPLLAACGGGSSTFGDGGDGDGGPPPPDLDAEFRVDTGGDAKGPCKNLECQIVQCGGGTTTSLSGTVVAPTPAQYGAPDPIYNAIVYVPNAPVEPFTAGVSCDKCGAPASGSPIAVTLTGYDGKFKLDNVPVGQNIPLVIQVGRWRRQIVIPQVKQCVDTPLTADVTRLPRNKSEGDIPKMAIGTSVYDPTECILRKIGVDDAEFTPPSGNGRIHIYKGNGASLSQPTPPSTNLWVSSANLKNYDLVALPCSTYPSDMAGKQNFFDYANVGGRMFVTDLSYPTISTGPAPWPTTANWSVSGSYSNPALIDTTFPKGDALAKWLQAIGATTTPGQLNLTGTYVRFSAANPPSQRWVYSAQSPQTYSFNTPVGMDPKDQCGRVVYSSFHVASSAGGNVFPAECTAGPMTAQEKVLEFMLFDLASCVQKDSDGPVPPPIPK